MGQTAINFLTKHHRKVIAVAAAGSLLSIAALVHPGLHEEYTIASFVGSDDPEFDTFQEFVDTFSGSELALIAVKGRHALDDETIACLEQMVSQVERLPAVQKASAISSIPSFARTLLAGHPLVSGVLISGDEKTATVIMQMRAESESGDLRKQTVARLREIVAAAQAQFPDLHIFLSGPYVTMLEMFDFVREDLKVFSICVALAMLVTLYLLIGSWPIAVYALGVAAAAVLCTLGGTVAFGVNMSLTTQMIVVMVAILAVATCIHLAVWQHSPTSDSIVSSGGSTARAVQQLLVPCTAVMLTSVVGFSSLCISDIQPIKSFGIVVSLALLWALLLAFAGACAVGQSASRALDSREGFHHALAGGLGRLAMVPLTYKWQVFGGFALLAGVLAWPIPSLKFESDFVKNFRQQSAVRTGYEFIENNLAPLGSIEVVVSKKTAGSIINVAAIHACDRLARQAKQNHESITKAISIVDVLRVSESDLPSSEIGLRLRFQAAQRLIENFLGADIMSNFVTADQSALRISLRSREGVSVKRKLTMADDVRRVAEQAFGDDYDITVTGLYYFYATLIDGLLSDQNRTFLITLVGVFVISAVCLRSCKLAAIGMVPNLFPMVACLGFMGWLQIPINMATSMMLAVSLGIAVDDTIHYLWRFRQEMKIVGDPHTAVLRCHRSVGKACVFTTAVITGGFWILIFSRFLPTAYFGALIGLTMLIALAADLILLPAMLVMFVRKN